MDKNHIISHETRRKRIYSLLSRVYCLPDDQLPELAQTLAKDIGFLKSSGSSYNNILQALQDPGDPRDLAVDFTRLFVGPYSPPAPPYGSIYLETGRKVMGDSTMDAASRYRRFGIQTAGGFRDVPDHIAAELEFMSILIHREIHLLGTGDYTGLANIICEQHSFLKDHLSAWVSEFTNLVIQNALMPFYRNLARLTRLFIHQDTAYLNQARVPEREG